MRSPPPELNSHRLAESAYLSAHTRDSKRRSRVQRLKIYVESTTSDDTGLLWLSWPLMISQCRLQGLYKKFRESGYRAVTMHFPPVFVTGGWRGWSVRINLGIFICLLPPGGWGQGAQFAYVIHPRRSSSCSATSTALEIKKTPAETFCMFVVFVCMLKKL